ncbi:unnamed protein product, partial [Prorocentrum cordatum]
MAAGFCECCVRSARIAEAVVRADIARQRASREALATGFVSLQGCGPSSASQQLAAVCRLLAAGRAGASRPLLRRCPPAPPSPRGAGSPALPRCGVPPQLLQDRSPARP